MYYQRHNFLPFYIIITLLSTIYLQTKGAFHPEKHFFQQCTQLDTHIFEALERNQTEAHIKEILKNGRAQNLPLSIQSLAAALDHGKEDIAKLLLAYIGDINAPNREGVTPLHIAAAIGRYDVTRLLLANNAASPPAASAPSPHLPVIYQLNPLHVAASHGHTNVVELLLDHKAPLDEKDWHGATPLASAVYNGYLSIVKTLLEHKASLHEVDFQGNTLLHRAVYKDATDIIRFLLESKASPHATCLQGNTPLHIAILRGHTSSIKLLLENHADPHKKNCSGKSALDLAESCRSHEIVKTLLQHHTDTPLQDQAGKTLSGTLKPTMSTAENVIIGFSVGGTLSFLFYYFHLMKKQRINIVRR